MKKTVLSRPHPKTKGNHFNIHEKIFVNKLKKIGCKKIKKGKNGGVEFLDRNGTPYKFGKGAFIG